MAPLQSDHEFAPTEIARAVFPTAFRGYDQDAVRRYLSGLAAALEHQQEYAGLGALEIHAPADGRIDELEAEIVELQGEIKDLELELVQRSVEGQVADEEGSPTPGADFDEHRAIELLGQETARVLESARSAAADILKRAEQQAASMKAEAKRELAQARRRAATMVVEKEAEVEEMVTRLADQAEADAQRIASEAEEHRVAVVEESAKILSQAEERAESEQAAAEGRARQIVADAETLRQQVIAELVAERRQAQVDLDRMIGARDRLAMSLAVARSEIDEVADSLVDVAMLTRSGGDDAQGEVDEEEVAGLIERLDHRRDDATVADPAEGADDTGHTEDAEDAEDPSDTEDIEDTEDEAEDIEEIEDTEDTEDIEDTEDTEDEAVDGPGPGEVATMETAPGPAPGDDDLEPTIEMPAIDSAPFVGESVGEQVDEGPAADEVESTTGRDASVATGTGRAIWSDETTLPLGHVVVDEPEVGGPSGAGVFDLGEGIVELDDFVDLDDFDISPDCDDDLNQPPAAGTPFTLVEGFSTLDVVDDRGAQIDLTADRAAAPEAESPFVPVGAGPDRSSDPAGIITTVSSRATGSQPDRNRGDLLLGDEIDGALPAVFENRDVALTKAGPNLRRQLRRALNDDQSEVLDRLRRGRGAIKPEELPPYADQLEHYLDPLRRGLTDIARSGARTGGADDLGQPTLDNLVLQLARFIVDQVRTPTVAAIEGADHSDRERILEPVRAVYRDFRNVGLADLAEDALHEAYAIGLYDSIPDDAPVWWSIDPRTDPDPVCEINRGRDDLLKGETFPSGHVRPLSLPGCRCLVVRAG